jgi:hypothetical protein
LKNKRARASPIRITHGSARYQRVSPPVFYSALICQIVLCQPAEF